jgi:LEA14-like dessication related protein
MSKTLPLAVLLLLLFAGGCSTVQRIMGYQEPDVRYTDMSIEGISLEQIDLKFHFEIDNPNRVGVKLEEYAYSLLINEYSFLSGSHSEQLEIASRSSGTIALPLTLSYRDLYESVSSVAQADSFGYRLNTEVGVNIPVYGKAMIPVTVEGTLPRLRMPRVDFAGFDVNSLSFSGVDMTLTLNISNPNPMGMKLSDLNLAASIGGYDLGGIDVADIAVGSGENLTVPVRLSMGFSGIGGTLMEMLRGNRSFSYEVKGDGLVELDHPAFRDIKHLPFHLIGDYRIGN